MVIFKEVLMLVGGRNGTSESLPIDVLNLRTMEWFRLKTLSRFRHTSWQTRGYLMTFGGFESSQIEEPALKLLKWHILQLFEKIPEVYQHLKKDQEDELEQALQKSFVKYNLATEVVVARLERSKVKKHVELFPLSSLQRAADKIRGKPMGLRASYKGWERGIHTYIDRDKRINRYTYRDTDTYIDLEIVIQIVLKRDTYRST